MTDKLKALALAATPGPWAWDGNVCDYDKENEAPWLVSSEGHPPVLGGTITCTRHNDASYIAAASPDAILALIKRVEDAEAIAFQWQNAAIDVTQKHDALQAEVERQETIVKSWLRANAPGGWIDDMRARVNAMESQEPAYWEYKGNLYQHKPNLIDDARPLFAAPGAAPDVYTNPQNLDTSQERVQKSTESVQAAPKMNLLIY